MPDTPNDISPIELAHLINAYLRLGTKLKHAHAVFMIECFADADYGVVPEFPVKTAADVEKIMIDSGRLE